MHSTISKTATFLSGAEKKLLIKSYQSKVFDGNALASRVRTILKDRIAQNTATIQSKPYLGYIIVGDLPQSELYVKLKLKACDDVGIGYEGFKLPAQTTESQLI